MLNFLLSVAFTGALLLNVSGVHASNNWSDIQRQAPDITLQVLESASLSLTMLSEPSSALQPRGTIVLLPDQQQHAFSPDLLNTLRLSLPAAGWHLLVLPAPDPVELVAPEEKLQLQKTQLAQRWQLLNEQANLRQPVIAIAQGETAALFNLLISETLTSQPNALVNLGAYLANYQQHKQLLQQVSLAPLPLLDLITAIDHPHATAALEQRLLIARQQNNALYRQRYLAEAYHDAPMQQWLTKEIIGWLRTSGF